MAYPDTLDDNVSLPNPTAGAKTNSPSHSQLHSNSNAAIKALETKLGIGNTTPSSTGLFLIPTGPGTTAWSQITSTQLAATLSDKTGTGKNVFDTNPLLVTPRADTISEATANNGVTVDGLNLKDGKLNTAASVPTAALENLAVTVAKLGLTIATGTNAGTAGGSTNYVNLGAFKVMWGVTNAITAGSGATGSGGVTFPVAFTAAPSLTAMPADNTSEADLLVYQIASATTTDVSVSIFNSSAGGGTGTAKIHWIAIGA